MASTDKLTTGQKAGFGTRDLKMFKGLTERLVLLKAYKN